MKNYANYPIKTLRRELICLYKSSINSLYLENSCIFEISVNAGIRFFEKSSIALNQNLFFISKSNIRLKKAVEIHIFG